LLQADADRLRRGAIVFDQQYAHTQLPSETPLDMGQD
jgi:hypothetical protein